MLLGCVSLLTFSFAGSRDRNVERRKRTGIVDQDVDVAVAALHLLKRFLNRFIAREIELQYFYRVARVWDLCFEVLNCSLSFFERAAAEEDMVWFLRFEQGLNSFVANAVVTTSNEDDLPRRHRFFFLCQVPEQPTGRRGVCFSLAEELRESLNVSSAFSNLA